MTIKKRELNILVIFNSLIGVIGGGSRHIIEVVDYWIDSHRVDYLISEEGYRVAKEYIHKKESQNKKIIVYSTPFDRVEKFFLAYISRIIKSSMETWKLRRKYDVVIAPNYLPQNMIPAIVMRGGAKRIVYFHNVPPSLRQEYLRKMNILWRKLSILNWEFCVLLSKFFDLIFVVNEATKDHFIRRGFPPKKVVVVGNGIPYNFINNINIDNKIYDGVFLARLVKRKGIYDLIKIWKIVIRKNTTAKLCIIGGGSEKEKLKMLIESEKLKENVILTGVVSEEEKYKIMKSSRVFVYPSYYESWGVVIAEAMACGLPVVAYHAPIYEEVFGEHIFTVEVGNYKKIAEKVLDILQNPQNYKEMVENAKNFVARYSWKEVAEHQLRNIVDIVENI